LLKQQNNKETRIFFWFPSNCWPWLFCTRFPVWNYNQKTSNKKHSSATRICLFRPFSTTWNYLAMNEEPSSTQWTTTTSEFLLTFLLTFLRLQLQDARINLLVVKAINYWAVAHTHIYPFECCTIPESLGETKLDMLDVTGRWAMVVKVMANKWITGKKERVCLCVSVM
jgi:hypothetical protein